MSNDTFDDGFSSTGEVAEHIIDEFAAANSGVAEVIPRSEIETQLEAVVSDPGAFDDAEWESLVTDVKDELLEHDIFIA